MNFSVNPVFVVIAIIALLAWMNNNNIEKFTNAKAINTFEDYVSEIKVLSAYVGPYVGDIYMYLRAKYFNSEKNVSLGPYFKPGGINDPTLADPVLPINRAQIKAWIDSAQLRIQQKYSKADLDVFRTKWDVKYEETPGKILKVMYVENGNATTYVI